MELYRYLYYQIFRVLKWMNPNPQLGTEKLLLLFQALNLFTILQFIELSTGIRLLTLPSIFYLLIIVVSAVSLIAINFRAITLKDVEQKYKNSSRLVGVISLIVYMTLSCLSVWYIGAKLN